MLILCIAFIAGFFLDVFWAMCVHAVANHRAIAAANIGTMFLLCTIVATLLVVEKNVPSIVAYAIGGWVGTYVAVKRNQHE